MKCEDLESILVETARGATNSEALAHAAGCRQCALRLTNERVLSDEFAGLAASSAEVPFELESRLLAEFNKRSKRRIVFTRGRIAMAAGIAATIFVAITWHVPVPEAPKVVRFEDPLPVMREGPVTFPALAPRRLARRHLERAKMRTPPERKELANDFIPLPYADPLTPFERAEVVRINVDQPGGLPFQADLILGQDGLARAVRFIRASQ